MSSFRVSVLEKCNKPSIGTHGPNLNTFASAFPAQGGLENFLSGNVLQGNLDTLASLAGSQQRDYLLRKGLVIRGGRNWNLSYHYRCSEVTFSDFAEL